MAATPALARLRADGIAHTVHAYPHDPRTTAFGDEACAALGVDPERFLKTLLVEVDPPVAAVGGGRAIGLACGVVPVAGRLDLKAFSRELPTRRAAMARPDAAERSSGYVRGGISPVGQRTPLACLVEETAMLWDTVLVSAGQRGLAVELRPADLLVAAGARYAAVTAAS